MYQLGDINNFNESCYMSCALLGSKSTIQSQFDAVNDLFNFTIFLLFWPGHGQENTNKMKTH